MRVEDFQPQVRTREDLARFVGLLQEDLRVNVQEWENVTLEDFLSALGGWVSDMPGWFRNQGMAEPDQPTWNLLAQLLLAAAVYE